jgi:serine/threonine protein kinase
MPTNEEIAQEMDDRAKQIAKEADERHERIRKESEERSAQITKEMSERSARVLKEAEERSARISSEMDERFAKISKESAERAARILNGASSGEAKEQKVTAFKQAFGVGDADASKDVRGSKSENNNNSRSSFDLSNAQVVKFIKSGENGSTSLLDNGLVFKTAKNADTQAELEQEAKFYRRVGDHPNIAKCFGMAKIGKDHGLVLECVKGEDLAGAMKDMAAEYKSGTISHEKYFGVLQYTTNQVLSAVEHLSQHGVVHNDVRADNIMLDADTGDVKLIDFGVAIDMKSSTAPHKFPVGYGTVAPEFRVAQSDKKRDPSKPDPKQVLSGKHDVFSVGATVYEAVEGEQFNYNSKLKGIGFTPEAAFVENEIYGRSSVPDGASGIALHKGEGGIAAPKVPTTKNQPNGYHAEADLTTLGQGSNNNAPAYGDTEPAQSDAPTVPSNQQYGETLNLSDPVAPPEAAEQATDGKPSAVYRENPDHTRSKLPGMFAHETDYVAFVNQMLHPDPSKRLSPEKARKHPFLADPLLEESQAREVLKAFLGPRAKQHASSKGSNSNGSLPVSKPSSASDNIAPKDPKPQVPKPTGPDMLASDEWVENKENPNGAQWNLSAIKRRALQLKMAGLSSQQIHEILKKEGGVPHQQLEAWGFPASSGGDTIPDIDLKLD